MVDMSFEVSVKVDIMLKKHSSLDRNICVTYNIYRFSMLWRDVTM